MCPTASYGYYPGTDRLETLAQTAGGESRVTRWTYLPGGEVETITRGYGSAAATTVTFGYDDARRLTRVTDGLGNSIAYGLDENGNVEAEDIHDAGGVLQKTLSKTFDDYDRLDVQTQANESKDYQFAPDGTLDLVTDGRTTVTGYRYDSLLRLTREVQNQGGTDPETANNAILYGYDTRDNLTSVTDPIDGVTTYFYDDLGRLHRHTGPDTGATVMTYDAAGNLKTRLDAKGQTFTYSYDVLDRLIQIDGPGTDSDVALVHDTCPNGVGRLCESRRDGVTLAFGYNGFGELEQHSQQALAATSALTYSHDGTGRVEAIAYPSGAVLYHGYDAAGRLASLQLDATVLASDIAYAPFGPIRELIRGNGIDDSNGYDPAYRPSVLGNAAAYRETIGGYDGNGNLTVHTDQNGTRRTYGYDPLDRLETAEEDRGLSLRETDYAYDRNGNRLLETILQAPQSPASIPATYAPDSNRMDTFNGVDVVLDANGNTTSLRGIAFTYTADNRLKTAGIAHYAYTAQGARASKTVSGSTTLFVYGLTGQLLAETDAAGGVRREYIYAGDELFAIQDPDRLYYVHNDRLGTPKALTDETGTVVWSAEHREFGEALVNEDPDGDQQAVTFNVRLPGQPGRSG